MSVLQGRVMQYNLKKPDVMQSGKKRAGILVILTSWVHLNHYKGDIDKPMIRNIEKSLAGKLNFDLLG